MNYFDNEKEWLWLFENGIDWDAIINLYYPSFPTEDGLENKEEVLDFFKELLTSTGHWAATSVAERSMKLDEQGPGSIENGRTIPGEALSELYKEASELQVFGLPLPRKFGGLETPSVLLMILLEQLSRACLSSSTQVAFFTSIAEMVHRYTDEETAMRIVPKIIEGKLSGSMNLTEPGCGSDLGMIKTSATPCEDGSYLLNGNKIFITNGGGGVSFVLARIKDAPEGLKGISLFLCEQDVEGKDEPNYIVAKNEHKLGMHGSFTCEIVYENSKSHLVGDPGEGFKYMLHLMNEARIAVGMQALGLIEASIGYARTYADERVQFDRPISDLPLMRRNLEDFETERDAIRALLVDTISHFDIFQKLDLKKNQSQDLTKEEENLYSEANLWTRKRTPLVKYYACEAATNLTTKAVQVLGGYGFMKEYPVERFHRDSFGPLLYEGTSQIQALMALKDVVKYAMKDPKRFFSNVLFKHPTTELLSDAGECSIAFKKVHFRFKKNMIALLVKCLRPELATDLLNPKAWANEEKLNGLMSHAETLCQALSYMETLRVLCEHAKKDESRFDLYQRYEKLIRPRLEAIYCDWDIR
ncbi:acyl-CoA dehydrogenase family protein [Halobacteriovorax sp. GB3]|uniref:acyl-CoA dehydrogenase family protein n=1 Tax=Halobacteriovorax sp. GB3 TaxID=2719615 RepID=UPI00235EAAEA|nr:acyl-CoA dehydrogenase family protein [Halobacteriovorax sp. GB3]MDD0852894.1 acyl-CoA dehydrogenase family protein [Halobacteriovorax sp. GB3]